VASAASNLGPNNPDLIKAIKQRQQQIAAFDHVKMSQIPADAVTASGPVWTRTSPRRTPPSR
jgi:K+-transporting ATPase ATPase C chain